MNPSVLFMILAEILPTLVSDGGQVIQDVAHGEGGVQKVAKVASDLGALLGHSAAALAPAINPAAALGTKG